MCTPQQLAIFGPQLQMIGSMQGGMNTGPGGPPTTGAASPMGGPQGSGGTNGGAYPSGDNLELSGPRPGTPGLVPRARVGQYDKAGKRSVAVTARPGREMSDDQNARGREYRPQQIFAEDDGPGPLTGGPVGNYMRKLRV